MIGGAPSCPDGLGRSQISLVLVPGPAKRVSEGVGEKTGLEAVQPCRARVASRLWYASGTVPCGSAATDTVFFHGRCSCSGQTGHCASPNRGKREESWPRSRHPTSCLMTRCCGNWEMDLVLFVLELVVSLGLGRCCHFLVLCLLEVLVEEEVVVAVRPEAQDSDAEEVAAAAVAAIHCLHC
jgi:hypothetical protein